METPLRAASTCYETGEPRHLMRLNSPPRYKKGGGSEKRIAGKELRNSVNFGPNRACTPRRSSFTEISAIERAIRHSANFWKRDNFRYGCRGLLLICYVPSETREQCSLYRNSFNASASVCPLLRVKLEISRIRNELDVERLSNRRSAMFSRRQS